MTHEDYMRQALELARACLPDGDVPVGCVVVSPVGEVIGRGRNRREAEGCAAAHAEIEAITQACINARIAELRYGAREEKSGCCGSVLNLFEERFNHRPRIYGGLLAEESSALLREFFQKRREKDETVV